MIFALSIGEGGARFLAPVYLAEQGNELIGIGFSVSIFGAAAMASRLGIGLTFTNSGVRMTMAVGAVASTLALYLVPATSSILTFTLLMAVHGFGWGILATVMLTLVLQDRGKRTAAAVIGFYIGVEGLGRTVAPAVAGFVGGVFGTTWGIRFHATIFGLAAMTGLFLLRNLDMPSSIERRGATGRIHLQRFRGMPLTVWVAAITGFYLNAINALLYTFFQILGLSFGFRLGQIGLLATSRSAVSAVIRFFGAGVFSRLSMTVLVIPLFVINAVSMALIGSVTFYPAQFVLWLPNGATRGLLRVGTMAGAMEDSDPEEAAATAALIGSGYDAGRIAGPAVGGIVAAAVGLQAMFIIVPTVFMLVILPLVVVIGRRDSGDPIPA
jgi:MFS family permease